MRNWWCRELKAVGIDGQNAQWIALRRFLEPTDARDPRAAPAARDVREWLDLLTRSSAIERKSRRLIQQSQIALEKSATLRRLGGEGCAALFDPVPRSTLRS
jgi:hypothetical protein